MLIVDRIEGAFAVLEHPDRTTVPVPLADLPPGLREGDCLRQTPDGYAVDAAETQRRRRLAAERLRKLRKTEE